MELDASIVGKCHAVHKQSRLMAVSRITLVACYCTVEPLNPKKSFDSILGLLVPYSIMMSLFRV